MAKSAPGSAASIGSKDQEPPWQVNASHAYRTSACQKQAHLKVSTGHGIADDGSAPRVGNTPMTPGDKRDPDHALTPAAALPTRAIFKLSPIGRTGHPGRNDNLLRDNPVTDAAQQHGNLHHVY